MFFTIGVAAGVGGGSGAGGGGGEARGHEGGRVPRPLARNLEVAVEGVLTGRHRSQEQQQHHHLQRLMPRRLHTRTHYYYALRSPGTLTACQTPAASARCVRGAADGMLPH